MRGLVRVLFIFVRSIFVKSSNSNTKKYNTHCSPLPSSLIDDFGAGAGCFLTGGLTAVTSPLVGAGRLGASASYSRRSVQTRSNILGSIAAMSTC